MVNDPDLRSDAAWILGMIGDSRAIPTLIKTLEDEQDTVRESAKWTLGAIPLN